MTTPSLDSKTPITVTFTFNIYAIISAFLYAVAIGFCAQHGDFADIPALLSLAVLTVVAFSIKPTRIDSSKVARLAKTSNTAPYFTPLLRRHCLGQ